MKQPDVVALLTVGSAAAPKDDVLQLGEAGNKQLVSVKQEGEKGLAQFFAKEKGASKSVLGPNGLPPLPASRHLKGKRYEMVPDEEQTYGERYNAFSSSEAEKIPADRIQVHVSDIYIRLEQAVGIVSLCISYINAKETGTQKDRLIDRLALVGDIYRIHTKCGAIAKTFDATRAIATSAFVRDAGCVLGLDLTSSARHRTSFLVP